MACTDYQCLEITDGDTSVSLLSLLGFMLTEWGPAVTEPKGGGVWRDSQLSGGRQLAMRKPGNVAETMRLVVHDTSPDDLIRDTQNLRRLLEKACAYRTSKWQDDPVWIKRQGVCETNPTYSLIEDYRTPQDQNLHGSGGFWMTLGNCGFSEFVLVLEREPYWRANPPGQGVCVQISGEQESWQYDEWTINTAQPTSTIHDIIEAGCGNLLACQDNDVWRTPIGGPVWIAAGAPAMANRAFVDATDGFVYVAGWTGVQRSGDCGATWNPRTAVIGTDQWHTFAEHGGQLYLSTGSIAGIANTVRRSNDGGATWTTVLDTIGHGAVFAGSDDHLYAGDNEHIYRSPDGVTWMPVLDAGYTPYITELGDGYFYASCGTGTPFSDNIPLYRSADGVNWGIIGTPPASTANAHTEALILTDDGWYFCLRYDGYLSKSRDAISWKFVADLGTNGADLVQYSGNDRVYAASAHALGEIWWSPAGSVDVGRSATCADEVYVTNKNKYAQLTNIWVYDAAGGVTWTAEFPHAGAFPFDLLPNPMANGDAVYFGIDPNVLDSGPFDNLVFDIGRAAQGTYTVTWQYSDSFAGWPNLNVQDGTVSFSAAGVNSVHWVPPNAAAPGGAWAAEAVGVPAVTCLWVRALIGGVAGNPVGPAQDDRDVYTCNWPHADVDEAQVLGDVPALMRFKFRNRSDEDGYLETIDELDLLENRVICGLRSLDRGPTFASYLNCADEQNPFGVDVAVGLNSAFGDDITAPTGRVVVHTTTGTSTWADECVFTLASSIARDFYGSFHAYVRAQEEDRYEEMDEVRVRLQVRTGTGGVTHTTDHKPFRNLNDWQLLDFGGVDVPASGLLSFTDLADWTELAIQVWSSVADLTVYLYDLILIPTDEWALDAVDKAMEDDSGVVNGYLLDADSLVYPKRDIRTLVRIGDAQGLVRSVYQPNTPGPAILQANADQRLWFLTARGCVLGAHTGANNDPVLTDANASFLTSGVEIGHMVYNLTDAVWGVITAVTAITVTATTLAGAAFDWDLNEEYLIVCPNWRSEPWNCHSLQVWDNWRYLSMRGAR